MRAEPNPRNPRDGARRFRLKLRGERERDEQRIERRIRPDPTGSDDERDDEQRAPFARSGANP